MRFIRVLTAAVILAGDSIGVAGPASAEEFLGVYHFESAHGDTGNWTVTPCGMGCANVGVTDTSSFLDDRFTGHAQLEDGQWSMTVDLLAAVRCELNQKIYPGRLEYTWNAAALTGTVVTVETFPNCGAPPMARTDPRPFTLTKAG